MRWTKAWITADDVVAVEFWDSPDVVPSTAILDAQLDEIGLVLSVVPRPTDEAAGGTSPWQRQSLERHVAGVKLPFAHGGRMIRDVKPRRPSGVEVRACHLTDPDAIDQPDSDRPC